MSQNRPVKIKGLASEWGAVKKWKDKEYLTKIAPYSSSEVVRLDKRKTIFSEYSGKVKRQVVILNEVMEEMRNNSISSALPIPEEGVDDLPRNQRPYISYMDD